MFQLANKLLESLKKIWNRKAVEEELKNLLLIRQLINIKLSYEEISSVLGIKLLPLQIANSVITQLTINKLVPIKFYMRKSTPTLDPLSAFQVNPDPLNVLELSNISD